AERAVALQVLEADARRLPRRCVVAPQRGLALDVSPHRVDHRVGRVARECPREAADPGLLEAVLLLGGPHSRHSLDPVDRRRRNYRTRHAEATRPTRCSSLTSRGSASRQSATIPMSAACKIGAVASLLIASTVRAARSPTVWLNLPLAPTLTKRRGA